MFYLKTTRNKIPSAIFGADQQMYAMRRVKLSAVMLVAAFLSVTANAQSTDPVLEFFGAAAEDELNHYDVERMEDFLVRPLKINLSSSARLEESGLFTNYQIASLTDYRARHGDVLSFGELAAVDGFGQPFVSRVAPFISLESHRPAGQSGSPEVRNDISVRSGIRSASSMTYGLKYKLTAGERLTGGISVSRTSAAEKEMPDAFSGHLAYYSKRGGKILLGDFNARFGQGLALWNGLSFSGLNSASSFMKRPSGISASSSFTGGYAFRGVAGDFRAGRFRFSGMTAFSVKDATVSFLPALNMSIYFRKGRLSLTHYADVAAAKSSVRIPDMKTSADFASCIDGTDLFAEVVYDWTAVRFAALGGIAAGLGEDVRMAAMLRYYPSEYSSERSAAARSTTKCSNEYAASLAADITAGRWITVNGSSGFGSSVRRNVARLSMDCAYFPDPKSSDPRRSIQLKAQAEWAAMISGSFKITTRLTERIRTWGEPFRTDLRTDFSYFSRYMIVNVRLNALRSVGTGFLAYAEAGYKTDRFTAYLKQGVFHIDEWADRIYAYERDAPGSFNVPAYYGRGIWTALMMNWRFARWGRMYLRAAVTTYPLMTEKKPGRAELKIQFVFRL